MRIVIEDEYIKHLEFIFENALEGLDFHGDEFSIECRDFMIQTLEDIEEDRAEKQEQDEDNKEEEEE